MSHPTASLCIETVYEAIVKNEAIMKNGALDRTGINVLVTKHDILKHTYRTSETTKKVLKALSQ